MKVIMKKTGLPVIQSIAILLRRNRSSKRKNVTFVIFNEKLLDDIDYRDN